MDERRALSPLVQDGLLPESFGMPTAGPGVYWLTLKSGDLDHQQTLEVREDPILKE
jgi:hypothetical protein